MKHEILNSSDYKNLNEIQRGFFDGFRKAQIMMVTNPEEGDDQYSEEIVEIIEKMAFIFVGELSDKTINPEKYYPVTAVAGLNSNITTK